VTRRYPCELLNFAVHSPEDSQRATENAVLRAFNGREQRGHSSTDRRFVFTAGVAVRHRGGFSLLTQEMSDPRV